MKNSLFIKNAAILTINALILRSCGIVFRIFISNKIGAEALGLYQLILSVYMLFSSLATSGIGIAVTRLIAENPQNKKTRRKIMITALFCAAAAGICSGLIMYFSSAKISALWLKDERALLSLKILCPSLVFMSVASALKGYFMAVRQVNTPANSAIFEQFVRIGLVLLIIDRFNQKGISYGCGAVVLGMCISEVAACAYLCVGYFHHKKKQPKTPPVHMPPKKEMRFFAILKNIVIIALPLTLAALLNTALHTTENLLVPDALTRYSKSRELSLSQFGMLKGMAIPLLFFPASFLSSLSALLLPEISEQKSLGNNRAIRLTISRVLQLTFISSIFIGALFVLFAKELSVLIYNNADVSKYILYLAPIIPFMYTESIVAGILNGLNQQNITLKFNIYNSVARIIAVMLFLPYFGIDAFLIIMVISNIYTASMSIHRILKVSGLRFDFNKYFIKPALCSIIGVCIAKMLCSVRIISALPLILVIAIGGITVFLVYSLLLLMSKSLRSEDIKEVKNMIKR